PARRPRPRRGRGAGDVRIDLARGAQLPARAWPRRSVAVCRRAQRDLRPRPVTPGAERRASGRGIVRPGTTRARRTRVAILAGPPRPRRAARTRTRRGRACLLERALAE